MRSINLNSVCIELHVHSFVSYPKINNQLVKNKFDQIFNKIKFWHIPEDPALPGVSPFSNVNSFVVD